MSEVTFAKSFLATLDKRAIKLPPDHVSDPRKYPNQTPYILPKNTHSFPRQTPTQAASPKTIAATLKPMRAGETITLPDIALDTTIYDIKSQYATRTGLSQDKIKLLLNKKPPADLKTLKDLGVDSNVEFSVMIMGGTGTTPRAQSPAVTEKKDPIPAMTPATAAAPPADPMDFDPKTSAPESEKAAAEAEADTAESVKSILETDEFWTDLQGFLSVRLKDEKEGERLAGVFRQATRKQ